MNGIVIILAAAMYFLGWLGWQYRHFDFDGHRIIGHIFYYLLGVLMAAIVFCGSR